MNYNIKISGSGSKRDIVIALKNLAASIKEAEIEVKQTFEDSILITEVSIDESGK